MHARSLFFVGFRVRWDFAVVTIINIIICSCTVANFLRYILQISLLLIRFVSFCSIVNTKWKREIERERERENEAFIWLIN